MTNFRIGYHMKTSGQKHHIQFFFRKVFHVKNIIQHIYNLLRGIYFQPLLSHISPSLFCHRLTDQIRQLPFIQSHIYNIYIHCRYLLHGLSRH